MKRIFVLTAVFIIFIAPILYAQTAIKAEVDKTKITIDDTLTYKLIIISSETQMPKPEVPKFEGFNLLSQAQSATFSLTNKQTKAVFVYAYILAPKEKGKFAIAPTTLKLKNSVISSESFEIEVAGGKNKPNPIPEKPQPQSQGPQVTL